MSTRKTVIALAALLLVTIGVLKVHSTIKTIALETAKKQPVTTTVVAQDPTLQIPLAIEKAQALPTSSNLKRDTLDLNSSNTVILAGPISEDAILTAQKINQLSKNGNPIYLLINSPGGSVMDGAQIITAIQASDVPVYTVCLGMCASMAAIIHQFGTKRLMQDRSFLMFHNAAGGLQGSFNQMKSRLNTFDRYVNKTDLFIATRAGITLPEFISDIAPKLWLDAEDATARKFNDKIVNVSLDAAMSSDGPSNKLKRLSPTTYLDNNIRLNNVSGY